MKDRLNKSMIKMRLVVRLNHRITKIPDTRIKKII